jgi:arginyl-tRNA synthetase
MKHEIETLIRTALAKLVDGPLENVALPAQIMVERTRDPRHGDFACNVAMTLAKPARRNPRELAKAIVDNLPATDFVAGTEIAGPGFINFRLAPRAFHAAVVRTLDHGADYGRSELGNGKRVLVEFVSANPTGPLHVGHGRGAAYGATVSNLLDAAGFAVEREYYVNDAGRQMNILGISVWLRFLEAVGEPVTFPANGYRGSYITDIAAALARGNRAGLQRDAATVFDGIPPDAPDGDKEAHIDALIDRARELLGEEVFTGIIDLALAGILEDIREDLGEFGVEFDTWYSERSLSKSGAIARALEKLEAHGKLYQRDGATWFRATDYGDEKDRVVVRENGQTTYFASDIAYHLEKRERGFDLLLDVLGADHHGYVTRVRAGLEAMGEPGDALEARLVQFVTLYRGGKKMQMSTRSGEFISLRQLRDEVGNDACRFFYVMRSQDQHLDFDLELAKSRSADNPVYYIQYAHARVESVMRQLHEKSLEFDVARGRANLGRLTEDHEHALLTGLSRYPEIVEQAASARAPHTLVHFLRELANDFHTYYNAHMFLVDDDELRDARLCLVLAVQQVIRNGLTLLGVSAPEQM